MEKRCPGCMKQKTGSPVCEHCGYNENVPNYSHQLPIGTVLQERYTIGKVLGQGGFGITYIGWDQSLQATVAIKEYYPNSFVTRDCSQSLDVVCAGDTAVELFRHNRDRFLREARILAKLSNVPGIVRVQNLFSENNTAYIVMEYVEGIDLKRYIRMQGRTLTVAETFAVLRPVMESLDKVHNAELVHRDISPDNIMILPDGSAKLLDFGAAREVENPEVDKELPQSTEAILKHGFAPIEQYRRRGSLGPWTDVYALCATMYYCLTGKVPNSAPERITGDDNIHWQQVPGLTQMQLAVLEHAMAILPEKRIRSMEQLHQGLFSGKPLSLDSSASQAPEDYPSHTIPLGKDAPGVMETKKKKKKTPAMLAAVLAAAALLGVFFLQSRDTDAQSRITLPETIPVTTVQTEPLPTETLEAPPENMLMEDYDPAIADEDAYTYYPNYTVFDSDIQRRQILSITFQDTLQGAPEDAWDISQKQDGSVMAWVEKNKATYTWVIPNSAHYDLYIAAEGTVTAPKISDYLFAGYENLVSLDFAGAFDTGYTTSMVRMFSGCDSLKFLDLSGFDTARVTDLSGMFHACKSVDSLDVSSFHTSNVTNMEALFNYCEELNFVDISGFDTANVTNMGSMFGYCSDLIVLDLSNFDTSNVTDMSAMFISCNSLTQLDISSFDTSKVTDMSAMFMDCYNLDNLNLLHFDTSGVTKYDGFMNDGKTVNGRPWKELFTSNQKEKANLLMSDRGPSALNGNEWEFFRTYTVFGSDIKRYKIMSVTFVKTLKDAPETAWDVSENLDGSVLAWVQTSADNYNYYDLYIGANGTITAPENCSYLFAGYDNARSIAFNDVLDTGSTTSMSNMFYGCTRLTELDVGSFDTGNVTDMSYMFCVCEQLWSISLRNFDTSKVTDMSGMFSACQNLNNIDVSSFDTSNVTNMSYMFTRLSVLQTLDLQHFDTSKVTDMSWMFSECGKLWRLKLGKWETNSVTNYEFFFFPDRKIEDQRWQDWFERKTYCLMADRCPATLGEPEYCNCYVFGSHIPRKEIVSISFRDTLKDASEEAWDVSANRDGSVLAWVEDSTVNPGYYDLYIGANGTISAPEDCGYLFAGYNNVQSISFGGVLDTRNVTSMEYMFLTCTKLQDLDVRRFDTAKVTNMCCMFAGCSTLTELDCSSFDTSAVTNMECMFSDCNNLRSLNVSSFDTANVIYMGGMFQQLYSLTALDLSGFDTSKVLYMREMFSESVNLTDLNLGNWETDNVNDYEGFLYPGKKINGQPWENLFP